MKRRNFLRTASLAGIAGAALPASLPATLGKKTGIQPSICLNAYSFNRQLRDNEMSLEDMFRFAAETGFEGVDLTAYQNHDDYIVTTDDILELIHGVDSRWFGLMLDIGSLPVPDPYPEIEKLIPYAITWQIKSDVKTGNGTEPTDFVKLMQIVGQHGYRGYLPIEALGDGDKHEKVRAIYQNVTENL